MKAQNRSGIVGFQRLPTPACQRAATNPHTEINGHLAIDGIGNLFLFKEIGRSERIRTSDPLLPKQVRYQAALRSDRVGRELSNPKGICKGYSCRYRRVPMLSTRCKIEARGVVTVSA